MNIQATGGTLRRSAELMGISYQSANRILWDTINSRNRFASHYLYISKPLELTSTATQFFNLGHISKLIGYIARSLIAIRRPILNKHSSVCRKGYHS